VPVKWLLIGTTFLWIVLAASGIAFGLLAIAYDYDPLATIDEETAEWIAAAMPTVVQWAARPPSWVGGWLVTAPIVVALGVALVIAKRHFDALWAAVALIGIHLVVTPLLKEAFDRPRPEVESAVPLPDSDAFPSGHASGAVVTFGVLATLATERWPARARELWTAAAVLAFAIGASRVVLGVHFLSDVLAGWALGLAWLAAALLVRPARRRRPGTRTRPMLRRRASSGVTSATGGRDR
jgi:membrane-associated phospholipid phosphatase